MRINELQFFDSNKMNVIATRGQDGKWKLPAISGENLTDIQGGGEGGNIKSFSAQFDSETSTQTVYWSNEGATLNVVHNLGTSDITQISFINTVGTSVKKYEICSNAVINNSNSVSINAPDFLNYDTGTWVIKIRA